MPLCDVFLGHNKSDVLENIIVNIGTRRYANLLGMENAATATISKSGDRIRIIRPLLTFDKEEIIEEASRMHLPYTYNSTPDTCTRGLARNIVVPALNQFGHGITEGLFNLSNHVCVLDRICSKLIGDTLDKVGIVHDRII